MAKYFLFETMIIKPGSNQLFLFEGIIKKLFEETFENLVHSYKISRLKLHGDYIAW